MEQTVQVTENMGEFIEWVYSIGAVNVHELIAVSHPYASRILQGYSGDVWSWNSNGCHEHDPVDGSYEDRRTTEGA